MNARARGITMIELLLVVTITLMILALFVPGICQIYGANTTIQDAPLAQSEAVDMANRIADSIASAPIISGSAITSATASSVTAYTNPAGALVKYSLTGGSFDVTVSGQTTSLYTGATLALTYYQSPTYNCSNLVSFQPVSAASRAQIVAVKIACSVTISGYSCDYATLVRLRNGPPNAIAFS